LRGEKKRGRALDQKKKRAMLAERQTKGERDRRDAHGACREGERRTRRLSLEKKRKEKRFAGKKRPIRRGQTPEERGGKSVRALKKKREGTRSRGKKVGRARKGVVMLPRWKRRPLLPSRDDSNSHDWKGDYLSKGLPGNGEERGVCHLKAPPTLEKRRGLTLRRKKTLEKDFFSGQKPFKREGLGGGKTSLSPEESEKIDGLAHRRRAEKKLRRETLTERKKEDRRRERSEKRAVSGGRQQKNTKKENRSISIKNRGDEHQTRPGGSGKKSFSAGKKRGPLLAFHRRQPVHLECKGTSLPGRRIQGVSPAIRKGDLPRKRNSFLRGRERHVEKVGKAASGST